MTPLSTKLKELRTVAEKALEVSSEWNLQHDDTYVAADKIPKEHDWYWITGNMETRGSDYEAGSLDEDNRGPKSVVQIHCRHIAAFNPEVALKLIDALEEAVTFVEKMSKGNRYPSTLKAAENTLSRINSMFTESGDGGAG